MSIIFLLILLSLMIAIAFLAAFFWAVRSGQYEDDYTPAIRILLDDEVPRKTLQSNQKSQTSNSHKSLLDVKN
ncbi:MAG: cbb3-type cytochrome oxidase assembly protein CcoS [Saprospiraceae bacterium]|nr:cbb3-type cytochrome oxidase assembly protein CcoS [Saprospiraceae bacterium]